MNFQLAKYSLLKRFLENIGFTTLEEYGAIFKYLIENVKTDRQIIYSPHCHDDLGMAVANSLAAVKNGAGRVEGTINGIRERAVLGSELKMLLWKKLQWLSIFAKITTK